MKKNSFWGWSFACAVALSWHAPVFAASPEMRLTEVQPATFKNPVVWADVPDPDVIRVGDYFYMVSTTMHLDARGTGHAFQRFGELGDGQLSFR